MKKKMLAWLLAFAMVFTSMPMTADAEEVPLEETESVEQVEEDNSENQIAMYNTDSTEITISTVEELQAFAKATQNGNTFSGKTVKLGENIDLSGTYWYNRDAEGNVTADYRIVDFAGTFDGNGKTISNISLQNAYDSGSSVGLCFFRSVTGTIKNLTLDGIDAECVGNASFYAINSTMNNAGGYNTENVHVKNVDVYIDNDECAEGTYSQVAGMIRWHGGSGGTGPECRSKDCTVTNLNAKVTGTAAVGGFSVFVAQRSWFYNCDVTNVTFDIGSVSYGAGGFAAQVQSSSYVQRLFDDCDVTNLDITVGYLDAMVGGFLGNLGGMVDCNNCDVTGKITITSDVENAHAGGFTGDLGWQGDWSSDKIGHTFDNCTADVNITAVNSDVGGFVGMSAIIDDTALDQDEAFAAVFTGCTASGDVTTVNGAAGGFVGSGDRGEYENCTATGVVAGDIAGGFWGEVFSMPAAPKNGNTGKGDAFTGVGITGCTASESVTGTTYTAGLVGYIDNNDSDTGYVTPVEMNGNTVTVEPIYNKSEDAKIPNKISGDITDDMVWNDGDIISGVTIKGGTAEDPIEITVNGSVSVNGTIKIGSDAISNVVFKGKNDARLIRSTDFTGQMFYAEGVSGNSHSLNFENITLDGGAIWSGDVDKTLNRGTINEGVKATGSVLYLLYTNVTMTESVLQNHDDSTGEKANAVFLRYYSTIEFNKSVVRNNNSPSSYYSGGVITVRQGGTAKTIESEVYGNSGAQGGYFGVSSTGSFGGIAIAKDSKFHNNYADAGAIFDMQCNSNKGYLQVEDCEFYDNASNRGLFYEHAFSRPFIIKDCTFTNNECAVWDCHTDPVLDISGKIVITEDADYSKYLFETPLVLSGALTKGSSIAMSEASITKLMVVGYIATGTKDYKVKSADLEKFVLPEGYELVLADVNEDNVLDVVPVKSEDELGSDVVLTLKDSKSKATQKTVVYSGIKCLPVCEFEHEGYVFAGWTDDTGNTVAKQKFTEATTLTAQWKLETPVVALSRDNATLKANVTNQYDDFEYTYQWYMDSVLIEGATETTYTMTDANIHKYKCEVTVTDGELKETGNKEASSSAPAIATVGDVNFATFVDAVAAANEVEGGATVVLKDNVTLAEKLTISGDVTISGEYTITRDDAYTGTLFAVNAGAILTLDGGLVVDGNNNWTLNTELYNKALNLEVSGTTWAELITSEEGKPNAAAPMFKVTGSVVANNVTIQNNYSDKSSNNGDYGVFQVDANATLTMTGAKIKHIVTGGANSVAHLSTNAVWTINDDTLITDTFAGKNGGVCRNDSGMLVMNGGTIEKNNSINTNGTVVMLYKGSMEMNGGKICSNTGISGSNNGRCAVIYGHSSSTFVMTDGEICHNTGVSYGGVDVPSSIKVEISGGYIGENISVNGNANADVNGNANTVISGGTFTQDVSEWLAPNTGLVYDEESGTYTTTDHVYNLYFIDPATGEQTQDVGPLQGNNLAEIVATGKLFYANYYTMKLEVLSNVKVDEAVVIDYPMTIDLNGKTITGAKGIDGVQVYPVIRVQGDADVTVKNGTITNADYVFVLGASDGSSAGNLTIESGKYHGATTMASVTKGTLTIKGGEFSVDPYVAEEGAEKNYNYLLNCVDANYKDGSAKIAVTGGTFHNFDPSNNAAEGVGTNFVAEGYLAETEDSGVTFTVREYKYVAEVNDVKYESVQEAVNAAKNGDTVKVLARHSVKDSVVIDKDITLDLNGSRIDADNSLTNKPVVRILANVTVTNGIIDGGSGINSYAFIVGNSETAGTLTITGGTYRGITSAISITKGIANISGGTFQTKHDEEGEDYGATYMLNCIDSAYADGTAKFNVTGGTYVGFNPLNNVAEGEGTNFCTDGYTVNETVTDDGITRYTVVKPVVEMDGKYYSTIKDALGTLTSADTTVHTVKVLQDYVIDVNYSTYNYPILVNGFAIKLDLNGKTISADWSDYKGTREDNALIGVCNGGKLTIIDSSEEQSGTIINDDNKDNVENRIFWIMTSTATKSIEVNIEGGNFIQNEKNTALLYVQGNKPSDNLAPMYVNIRGGYFETVNDDFFNAYDNFEHESYITGGTFSKNPTDWEIKIHPDFKVVENEDGTFGVVGKEIAAIGEEVYPSISKAVEAAKDNDTIKVLESHDISEAVVINKNILIDLNGNTITGAAKDGVQVYPVIRVQNDANVTVKNGTIINADYVFVLGASDGSSAGNITIESGKYHGATTVASVTKGTLTINGGEFSVEPYENSYEYLLNCVDANYKDGTAKIEVKGGTFHKFNPANNAAEGTETNFVVEDYEAVYNEENSTYTVQKFNYVKWVKEQLLEGKDVILDRDITINDYELVNAPKLPSNGNGKYDERHGNGAVFHVTKPGVELDLNGHSITWDAHHEDYCNKRQVSLFMVTVTGNEGETADLTIKDSSEAKTGKVDIYGMGTGVYVVCTGAKATVEAGAWTNYPCKTCGATNIFMYPSHGGELYISGGTFEQKVENPYLVAAFGSTEETTNNGVGVDYDSTKVEISGGTFVGMNPEEIKFFDNANGGVESTTDGCAPGYIPVDNGNGTYGVKVGAYVAVNVETKEGYEDLNDALANATSDQTVKMLIDSSETFVKVPTGVTLDLNGNYLTATDFLSYGDVIDTAVEVGGIMIDVDTTKSITQLQPDNVQLPIYDTENGCYRFFEYSVVSKGHKEVEGKDAVKFGFRIEFTNYEAYKLLAETDNSAVNYKLEINWTGLMSPIHYTINADTLAEYAATAYGKVTGGRTITNAMVLTLSGCNRLQDNSVITVRPYVDTVSGVTSSGEMDIYDVPVTE